MLVVACVGLAAMQYGGSELRFIGWFGDLLREGAKAALPADSFERNLVTARDHPWYHLLGLAHWVAFCVIGYALVPMAFLALARRRIRDCNVGLAGFLGHLRLYAALFGVMVPIVYWASTWNAHGSIYPFYVHAGRSWFDLLAWEALYFVQFCALEFFFRGFLLQGLRKWIGYAAIFVMLLPYCMIHFFGKTFAESMGSLVAGVVLGTLAMRYRSIWGGAVLHWFVAGTMDALVLWHRGKLPTVWWPEGM